MHRNRGESSLRSRPRCPLPLEAPVPRKRPPWFAVTVCLLAAAAAALWWSRTRLEHSQDGPIRAAASRYGVDPALVKAVVWRESGFRPKVRGSVGEIGLMQVTDAAAQEWAEAEGVYPLPEGHLFDPRTNTLAGTWYLGKLLRRYRETDRPAAFALADYNAGRGNVLKWMKGRATTNSQAFLDAVGFRSTRAYVAAVLDRHDRYTQDFRALSR